MKSYFKKLNIVLFFGMVSMFCSCCSDELIQPEAPVQETDGWHHAKVKFNIECEGFDQKDGSTRAASNKWQDGDVVYLLLTDKDGNKVQAYVRYDGSKQTWGDVMYDGYKNNLICTSQRKAEAFFLGGATSTTDDEVLLDATDSVYACYEGTYTYPSDGTMETDIVLKPITSRIRFVGDAKTEFSIDGMTSYYSFSRSTGQLVKNKGSINTTVKDDGTSPYIYGMFSDSVSPSLSITHSGCTFLTEFESDTPILTIGRSGKLKLPTRSMNNGWNMTVNVASVSLDKTSLTMERWGGAKKIVATVLPNDATDKSLIWTSSNSSVIDVDKNGEITVVSLGTANITVMSASDVSKKATCSVKVVDTTNGHACVDLGLSSGTLWATKNIGATTESDYGSYFAFGETSTYSGYTSFYYSGKLSILPLDNDVAHVKWGGSWRMPTKEQCSELCSECTWTWTTIDGVYGQKVSSKKNSNSIFLPAAGYSYGSTVFNKGESGEYWSSSTSESNRAYGLTFLEYYYLSSTGTPFRYNGLSIRPVLSE